MLQQQPRTGAAEAEISGGVVRACPRNEQLLYCLLIARNSPHVYIIPSTDSPARADCLSFPAQGIFTRLVQRPRLQAGQSDPRAAQPSTGWRRTCLTVHLTRLINTRPSWSDNEPDYYANSIPDFLRIDIILHKSAIQHLLVK